MRTLILVVTGVLMSALPLLGQRCFIRGDIDDDGTLRLNDVVFLISDLAGPSSAPFNCEDAYDLNDDGVLDLADAIQGMSSLFVPGSAPLPPPFPTCGIDPTPDGLDCEEPRDQCSLQPYAASPDVVLGGAPWLNRPVSLLSVDLDGDSDMDLICGNDQTGGIAIFLNENGTLPTAPQLVLLDSTGIQDVLAIDLDADSYLDLVAIDQSNERLVGFFQSSPGVFSATPDFTIGGFAATPWFRSIAAADLDSDGDVDLVSAHLEPGHLNVFFQTAPRVFSTTPDLTLGGFLYTLGAMDVIAEDLDGDGDVDLANANYFASTVTVFLQSSPGVFPTSPTLTLGGQGRTSRPHALTAADLDQDGDLDLVAGTRGHVALFFQSSPGVFEAIPTQLSLESDSTTVVAGDFDGDGDTDVASNDYSLGVIQVYFQCNPGGFAPEPNLTLGGPTTTAYPRSLQVGDLNGDGRLDLITAGFLPDKVYVFFQTP